MGGVEQAGLFVHRHAVSAVCLAQMFGTYINPRSHSGLYSLLFYKVDVAFVVYHDQPFVEQHIEGMYGLRGPCSPASIAYAGKELMALRIKNLGTASFVGDINLVVGTGDTVRAAAEFPGSFSVLPFLDASQVLLAAAGKAEHLYAVLVVRIVHGIQGISVHIYILGAEGGSRSAGQVGIIQLERHRLLVVSSPVGFSAQGRQATVQRIEFRVFDNVFRSHVYIIKITVPAPAGVQEAAGIDGQLLVQRQRHIYVVAQGDPPRSRLFVSHVSRMAVAHTVGKLVEYGFGDAFVIGIVFQITHFMHAEGGSSAQSHHAGGIAEGQSAVVEHVGQQGGLVYFRLVIVAVQRAELVQGSLEPFRREHIRHVQRDGHRLTRVRSLHLVLPAVLGVTVSAEGDVPFATDGLQPCPVRVVTLYGEGQVFFREVGVCHDPYFLSAAGIGGQVLGGERYVYPELLERHDLFQRHELEFFLVTVYPGPESHVFQGSGTIETVLVVHSELKRPADVEAALAGVEINILGFIVIQQVIRVVRVIIRFGQPDGQFVVCHVSFSGNRKFVLFAATQQ